MFNKYLELKKNNNNKLYLFKSGNFYIFLDEDAKTISKYTTLKLSSFSNNVLKCGFPLSSLDKYLEIFNNIKLNIEIIDNKNNKLNQYLDYIKNLNISNMNPLECMNILNKLKDLI